MRADVFQAVALCCHSNAFLRGTCEAPPELLSNSTFIEVNEVMFERSAHGKLAAGVVADAPAPWLRRIRKEGVERLYLSLVGCPLDPMETSATPWGIVCDGDVGVEIWQPLWKKRIRSHSDPSPWRVLYSASRTNRWQLMPAASPDSAGTELRATLRECLQVHSSVATQLRESCPPFPDLFPEDWPMQHREIGLRATAIIDVLRSKGWAELLDSQKVELPEHAFASKKLWKAALSALEASVAVEHPRVQTLPRAG